jgi:hypothetical protein
VSGGNPYQEKKATSVNIGAVFVCVGLLVPFLLSVKPNDDESVYLLGGDVRLPGKCYSRGYFDVDCPGCGLTRSIVCISHGQWNRAAGFNIGGFAIYFGAVFFLVYSVCAPWISPCHLMHGRRFWTILIWVMLGLLIGQWLVRSFAIVV